MPVKFKVLTSHPLALDSDDFINPGGVMHDKSTNQAFNNKLYKRFPVKLWCCDLGCAGGNFVESLITDGHEAIGLEGSDYNTKWDFAGGSEEERAIRKPGRRESWARIPDNLFLADITYPFEIFHEKEDGQLTATKLDFFFSWEVAEHLNESRLPTFCKNLTHHLKQDGYFITSVSQQVGPYHVCLHPKAWWCKLFEEHGLINDEDAVSYFGDDWIRGPLQNAPESFHLCLRKK